MPTSFMLNTRSISFSAESTVADCSHKMKTKVPRTLSSIQSSVLLSPFSRLSSYLNDTKMYVFYATRFSMMYTEAFMQTTN